MRCNPNTVPRCCQQSSWLAKAVPALIHTCITGTGQHSAMSGSTQSGAISHEQGGSIDAHYFYYQKIYPSVSTK
eukprot:12890813-Prorocentrum_lima.AAC.1